MEEKEKNRCCPSCGSSNISDREITDEGLLIEVGRCDDCHDWGSF
jgi:predicted  nucleic acid-binding Zn ribbon protein